MILDPLDGEDRYTGTKFWVEANNFEIGELWDSHGSFMKGGPAPYKWEQISAGELVTVGSITDVRTVDINPRPVCISVRWFYINGVRVGFYNATSELVDHKMIRDWFAERYPVKYDKGYRNAYTDAGNFHHCLHALEELA